MTRSMQAQIERARQRSTGSLVWRTAGATAVWMTLSAVLIAGIELAFPAAFSAAVLGPLTHALAAVVVAAVTLPIGWGSTLVLTERAMGARGDDGDVG